MGGDASDAKGATPKDKSVWTPNEVFDHEASLRSEIAELTTEAAWLRSPPDKTYYSGVEAMLHVEGLQREIAALRREVSWLRRDNLLQAEGSFDVPVVRQPRPRLPGADHGASIFLTMCAGATYFDTYCGPFLASFERAYGAAASDHRVVVFHAAVEPGMLASAQERFKPWAHFEPLPRGGLTGEGEEDDNYNTTITGNSDNMVCELGEGKILSCNVTDEGVENRGKKVSKNNHWLPFHMAAYLAEHGDGYCYTVLIDSDTLFVRPIGQFLPKCDDSQGSIDWDVAFTTYDPEFVAPWAEDSADVGRTKKGYSRVNTGVVLVSLRDRGLVQSFLHRWAQVTTWLHGAGDEALGKKWEGADKMQWEIWHDELLGEFRGPNQAGLVLLVCSYQTARLATILGWGEECGACNAAVPARIDLLSGEAPALVRFRALPARLLNHPESMVGGNFPPGLLVVHLKGLWWRTALPRGATFFVDDHRRSTWNRDSLALHRLVYETWHFALPPEARPSNNFRVKDAEGNAVSNSELQEALGIGGAADAPAVAAGA